MQNPFRTPFQTDAGEMNWIQDNPAYQEFLMLHFAWAIAEFEGFFIPDSISQRNNNPGNLRPIGSSTGFQQFETPELGWERLLHQIRLNVKRGLTMTEFFLGKPGVYPGYAPLGDNDPEVMKNYIQFVKDRTGITDTFPLQAFFQNLDVGSPEFAFSHRWPPKNRITTPNR